MNICSIIIFFFGITCLIIGIPIWFTGCDKSVGGPCVRYNKYTAFVVSNTCYETHGASVHNSRGIRDDDTIGNNCNVHVKYTKKGIDYICPIYRSDQDYCRGLVTSMSQSRECDELNAQDYPINSYTQIYVDNYDTCYSSHYVRRLAIIGFVFLIFGFVFTIGPVLDAKIRQCTAPRYEMIKIDKSVHLNNQL